LINGKEKVAMTDNMKKFLEGISGDKEVIVKLSKALTPEAVIELAAEKGFTLTEEDLKPAAAAGELSEDELNAVAGGVASNAACGCVLGGGGGGREAFGIYYDDQKFDRQCTCVLAGGGDDQDFHERCTCPLVGGGLSVE